MEHEKCLVELDEILKHLEEEDLIKIPYEIRTAISKKKNKQYSWNYDESKTLNQQNIDRKTIAMLSYLNIEYLLNKEEKLLMEELHRLNEKKIEKEKKEKYNPNEIFKENTSNVDKRTSENNYENHSNMQMSIKEDEWYKKIIKIIRNIFHKRELDK